MYVALRLHFGAPPEGAEHMKEAAWLETDPRLQSAVWFEASGQSRALARFETALALELG